MKYNGENLVEVLQAHQHWLDTGGEDDTERADFTGANLRNIMLPGCDLTAAILRGADLSGSCLYRADLTRADLTGSNLRMADLTLAVLRGVIGMPFYPRCVPDTGSFIGWKRVGTPCEGGHSYEKSIIVKLLIPEDAKRESLYCGEYRASKAKVLELQTLDGKPLSARAIGVSLKDGKTLYIAGDTVEASNWVDDRLTHWLPGIYFFLDRQAAVCYGTFGGENPRPILEDSFGDFPGIASSPEMEL